MITRIEIDGFKTFRNFVMEFSPFTVVAGANASGKSNLFDALRLLSRLATHDLRNAFNDQRGEPIEQFTIFSNTEISDKISFGVELLVDKKIKDNWGGEAVLKYTRLRYELTIRRERSSKGFEELYVEKESLNPLKHEEDVWIKKHLSKKLTDTWRPKVKTGKRGIPYILTEEKNGKLTIRVPLDGKPGVGKELPAIAITQTVLSGTNSVEFPHVFAAKEEIRNWNFLQLNPEELRKPSPRMASDIITQNGANLASCLFRIKTDDETILKDISRQLNNLLPNFVKVDVDEDLAGNQFVIKVFNEDGREFSSRILSEGTLRLLILCVLKYDDKNKGVLSFEEPENGIHPYRLRMMLNLLLDLTTNFNDIGEPVLPLRQVIINTHSPVLINDLFEIKNTNITIWFSQLISQITNIGNNLNDSKVKFRATKILPVIIPINKINKNYQFDFVTKKEEELTLNEVINYLSSSDFEGRKKQILENE
jgi:predicted ATPase